MTIYNTFYNGWGRETTFGTSVINGVGSTAYLWGAEGTQSKYRIQSDTLFRPTGVNAREVPAGNAFKSQNIVTANIGVVMQNGILLQAVLGKSSTAGAGPYTHTITPYDDGTRLDSFTINGEQLGTATNFPIQVTGAICGVLTLKYDLTPPAILLGQADFLCKKLQDGQVLTTKPQLPATATTTHYDTFTRTFNSVALDGLKDIEITIDNGLDALFANTNDAGTYTGMWCFSIAEAPRIQYEVRMLLHPSTVEDDLFDEAVSTGNTKDLVLKWQKASDTNDYIQLTFSDCHADTYEANIPSPVDDIMLHEVVMHPERLSVEVKDSIAGGLYGE